MQLPELPQQPQAIYIDFEGLPDEKREYLLGAYLFMEENKPVYHAFWSDGKLADELIFRQLFILLNQYPDAPI